MKIIWTIYSQCFLACLLMINFGGQAQSVHQFTEGLVVGPCHHYGREALYTDQLVYQLYKGELQTPRAGQTVFTDKDDQPVSWQTIRANQEGRFKDSLARNGYLYLTYQAEQEGSALLQVAGHSMLYVNGEPRTGDIYNSGWMYLPVSLKKGLNEMYIRTAAFSRYQGITAKLLFPQKPVLLNTEDATLPHIVPGQPANELWGALVIINTTSRTLTGLQLRSQVNGNTLLTSVPSVPPMTTRKVGFRLNAGNVQTKGTYTGQVALMEKNKVLDEQEIQLTAPGPGEQYSNTFISHIDGSVQYYSVTPQSQPDGKAPALFLSVHGAAVEAISQARAYKPKDWGVLVAPTNRRPRGFNWEDWGRLDAMEVLEIAKQNFKPDPSRIYLTGHSMGGHGTWYLGATYPEKWAAIAPCAGYPTLATYGSHDGMIPEAGASAMEKLLLRSSNPSNVIALASNYKPLGVYILHGDSDRVVSVEYARQMRKLLGNFHADFSYYEYPGGSHWYGDHSVDWQPIFDFFRWHQITADSAAHVIDFTTANPAISATMKWATIEQQVKALEYSRIQLIRNKAGKTIKGSTENVARLTLKLNDFSKGDTISVILDSQSAIQHIVQGADEQLYLHKEQSWVKSSPLTPAQKGPHRNGTFKEPFNHRMVFVYATGGSPQENAWAYAKARYDAETWYYRGNGAVDILADKEFDAKKYKDRGVVLYGNATTNRAWKSLLANCPIQVRNGGLKLGNEEMKGTDLGVYFAWPRADSPTASVAVIAGTGLPGMRATDANQYFSGGSGFPDFMVFSLDMLKNGVSDVKTAGFFGNDWSLQNGEIIK